MDVSLGSMAIKPVEFGRIILFGIAVGLYMLATTFAEEEMALSAEDLIDVAFGSVLAALIVFFALPHLLYKSRYIAFILFYLVGIIVFAVFEEWLLYGRLCRNYFN